jgi:cytosine/adenosine deaminase-related metal-dependent hydrolase
MLQSGITSVVDVASSGGSKDAVQQDFEACLQAYETAGMRVAFTAGVSMDSHFIHHEDDTFLTSLPTELRQQVDTLLVSSSPSDQQNITPEEYLTLMTNLITKYQDHDTIDIWMGPPGPQWVGDELLQQITTLAQTHKTQVQTHALESYSEKLVGPRFHNGCTMVQHLHENVKVLSPQFSIAHGTWLTEDDLSILVQTGAAVSHNPSSNLRLRAGMAPLNAMIQAGVTVGLGLDGTTLNDDDDMFTEMRLAARLHRTPQFYTPAPTYEQIFHMATTGGATLMGKAHQIGKLEVGYKADMVLLNTQRFTKPWMAPDANPLHVLLLRAKAMDVDTVLVNGKVVLQHGMPTMFDLSQVEQSLVKELQAQPSKAQHQKLVQELRPYLIDWYSKWEQPILEPYAAFNSKT